MENDFEDLEVSQTTCLQCRVVRIGSYTAVCKHPTDVFVTPGNITFKVPEVDTDKLVEVNIKKHDLIKVLVHLGKELPVLFLYTRPAAASTIRKVLKMKDEDEIYYDSVSSDNTHRRIILFLQQMDIDYRNSLKKTLHSYGLGIVGMLNRKDTEDILISALNK